MNDKDALAYERYLPWKRWVEAGFWVAVTAANCIANSLTTLMELRRGDSGVQAWEPVVWEASSALVWLLVLIPAIVGYTRWRPVHWDNWRRRLAEYVGVSLLVCLVHVVAMVALRVLAYRTQGMAYEFGPWPRELAYEYLKDVRSFATIVVVLESYRFLLRRWQGEASLLAEPDEGPPLEPVDQPERFLVRKLGREFLVAANDIEWAQAAGNYVNLRVRGHDYPLRSTIAGIESRLDRRRFARIHRSYIVSLEQVASIEPLDTGDARVHLKDGGVLPCSRRYRQELRQRTGADVS
ncbi:LytTR family transcriptional regulator [Pseudoxanthomonas sp. LH2527]|uniref:LytTR family DNA-binding domain-containing protein n=1 Tax=Pseudoxanthomonas sp. LH2527 TaxID=2923249 RepID=UPI001F13D76F|nr:LytTR family DNA-binding domain-containing protein [Pseudoxanthomonas sp. LH2527]MCH6482080.1 LytTR family transcriptional regulator [Pseudoxanthomonas sp. LH2527]